MSINQASQGEMFVAKKSPDERGDWESYNFILVHKTNYSDAVIKNLTKTVLSMMDESTMRILVLATRYGLMLFICNVFLFWK